MQQQSQQLLELKIQSQSQIKSLQLQLTNKQEIIMNLEEKLQNSHTLCQHYQKKLKAIENKCFQSFESRSTTLKDNSLTTSNILDELQYQSENATQETFREIQQKNFKLQRENIKNQNELNSLKIQIDESNMKLEIQQMQENNYKNNLIQLFSKFGKLPLLVDTKGIDEIMQMGYEITQNFIDSFENFKKLNEVKKEEDDKQIECINKAYKKMEDQLDILMKDKFAIHQETIKNNIFINIIKEIIDSFLKTETLQSINYEKIEMLDDSDKNYIQLIVSEFSKLIIQNKNLIQKYKEVQQDIAILQQVKHNLEQDNDKLLQQSQYQQSQKCLSPLSLKDCFSDKSDKSIDNISNISIDQLQDYDYGDDQQCENYQYKQKDQISRRKSSSIQLVNYNDLQNEFKCNLLKFIESLIEKNEFQSDKYLDQLFINIKVKHDEIQRILISQGLKNTQLSLVQLILK